MKLFVCIALASLCSSVAFAGSSAGSAPKCLPPIPEDPTNPDGTTSTRCIPTEQILANCWSNAENPTGVFWSVTVSEPVWSDPAPYPIPEPIPGSDGGPVLKKRVPARNVNVSVFEYQGDTTGASFMQGMLRETPQGMQVKFADRRGSLRIHWFDNPMPIPMPEPLPPVEPMGDDDSTGNDNSASGFGKLRLNYQHGAIDLICERW